jgi:16S rRNA (guanine527-N7)-methyltransferase
MADAWASLLRASDTLGLALPPEFEAQARAYLAELDRWSRVGRLTGYRREDERVIHLLAESLMLLPVLPAPAAPLLDIGSGAGVPGLVLKLARPEWPVTLIEASRRRANFLRHVTRVLGLAALEVREGRAEALATEAALAGSFQTVTLRAVAVPREALALARPFLAAGAHAVLALGPGSALAPGVVREVTLASPDGALRLRRRFLIIAANGGPIDVPRGTRGVGGPGPGRRQSEGRGREDHDRGESGRGARGC